MILVFGKTGQVATELQSHKDVLALGRGEADLSIPKTCTEAIKYYKPRTVINAAAYTAVDKAESEESLANTINGDAPGAMVRTCGKAEVAMCGNTSLVSKKVPRTLTRFIRSKRFSSRDSTPLA